MAGTASRPSGVFSAAQCEGAVLQTELLRIWEQSTKTTLFITHSIEEAVYLADRVLVMAAHPGRIISEVAIDLKRPRDKQSSEFNEIERHIDSSMRGAKSGTQHE